MNPGKRCGNPKVALSLIGWDLGDPPLSSDLLRVAIPLISRPMIPGVSGDSFRAAP